MDKFILVNSISGDNTTPDEFLLVIEIPIVSDSFTSIGGVMPIVLHLRKN